MTTWQRRRKPDEVPTPVAVAVSDFCRRAKAPAPAAEVRDALSALAPEEDFRVRGVTDEEPSARPLGPFAVVDMLRGTSADLARQRQESGYYELVRELLSVRDQKVIEVEVPAPAAKPPVSTLSPPRTAAPEPGKKAAAQTVAEKIAPRKREAAAPSPGDDVSADQGPLLPYQERQRDLPKPRGRFARVDATRGRFEELLRGDAKAELETLIEQQQNRQALLAFLADRYGGRRGSLTLVDVMDALKHHRLVTALEQRERAQVLSATTEHRGALGRVSWTLGISPADLKRLLKESGLEREVEEVRERFRREALAPQNLTLRLDLLGREKYLTDLNIKKRFSESLEGELRRLIHTVTPSQPLPAAVEELARKQGAPTELLQRAIDKLGLTPELQRFLSGHSVHPE